MATGHIDATPLSLPFNGESVIARHCSAQGAQQAAETANSQALALLALYHSRGPLTDQEAADTLRIQRCAVNARRASLIKLGLVDPEPKGTRKNPRTGVRNATWGLV